MRLLVIRSFYHCGQMTTMLRQLGAGPLKRMTGKCMDFGQDEMNEAIAFGLETKKFVKQYPRFKIEVRKIDKFHDRFIIPDDPKCFHMGASIKDAGGKAFMISQVEDSCEPRRTSEVSPAGVGSGNAGGVVSGLTSRMYRSRKLRGTVMPSVRPGA